MRPDPPRRSQRHRRRLVTCGVVMAVLSASAQTLEFEVIPRGVGARIAALGHAGTSEMTDVSSMYANPAGLAMLERPSAMANSAIMRNGAEAQHLAAASLAIVPDIVIGVGAFTSSHGREWQRPQLIVYGLDLGVGYRLSTTVSFGVLTHMTSGSSANTSLSAASMSWGALYVPTRGVAYGLAYRSLGWGLSYRQRGTGRSPLRVVPVSPRVLEVGSTFRFPAQFGPPDITIMISSGRLLGEATSINKAGIELYPLPYVDLRVGIQKAGSLVFGHFGFGARLAPFQIDYAYIPLANEAVSHEITLSMIIPALSKPLFRKD